MCSRYEEDDKEIYPSEEVQILISYQNKIGTIPSSWGFMINGHTVINAKKETLYEKKTFKDLKHCIIKADHYYEWDQAKHKVKFSLKDNQPLYMAGLVRKVGQHFEHVIITTKPNKSVQPIHDRMPLILKKEYAYHWLLDHQSHNILQIIPEELEVHRDIEQIMLFEEEL